MPDCYIKKQRGLLIKSQFTCTERPTFLEQENLDF